MRANGLAALGVALMMAGCVTTESRWIKPGATVADFDTDKLKCQYEAELATANRTAGYGLGGAIASGIDKGMTQANLMTMCMRTKGWTLEQVASANPE